MSRWERHNQRCSAFSTWHRTNLPDDCKSIDLDWVEYHHCGTPLAIFEIARDQGQIDKSSTVTRRLGELAGIRTYVILYSTGEDGEFNRVRIKRIAPDKKPEDGSWATKTPEWLAGFITKIHREWACVGCDVL